MTPHILVAGIGNVFKGDDGFGVAVAQQLAHRVQMPSVRIVDFGIRGIDLAYALLDGCYEVIIIVDVVQRGGLPGSIYQIEPDLSQLDPWGEQAPPSASHGMHPAQVLGWVQTMGGTLGAVQLIGCEPAELWRDDDLKMGLSEPVQVAVDRASTIIERMIVEMRPALGRGSQDLASDGE